MFNIHGQSQTPSYSESMPTERMFVNILIKISSRRGRDLKTEKKTVLWVVDKSET